MIAAGKRLTAAFKLAWIAFRAARGVGRRARGDVVREGGAAEIFAILLAGILTLVAAVIALTVGTTFLLVGYGVLVLVFRHAFGVELPNPFDWLPPEWR